MNNSSKDWLAELELRLRSELDDLYLVAEEQDVGLGGRDDAHTQRRIARILRAFHLIETGEYGSCAVCGDTIALGRLSQDPASDTCDTCGPPPWGSPS